MSLALVVVVDDLEPKITISSCKRSTDFGNCIAPLAAVLAKHKIRPLVILKPRVDLQPTGLEPAELPRLRLLRSLKRSAERRLYHGYALPEYVNPHG